MKKSLLFINAILALNIARAQEPVKPIGNDFNFKRNLISLNILNLANKEISLSYERFNESGNWSFRVPLSVGFKPVYRIPRLGITQLNNLAGTNTIAASGFGFNYYPSGQGKSKYFIGASLDAGIEKYIGEYALPDTGFTDYGFVRQEEYVRGFRADIHINNGWMYQATKHLNLSAVLGLGMGSINYWGKNTNTTLIAPSVNFRLGVGYRFGK